MPPHSYVHKWNVNTDDIMMTWFTLHVNLAMSCLACTMCMDVHGACALCRTSTSKYFSGLVCMQANPILAKITASHFWVLNSQNAN